MKKTLISALALLFFCACAHVQEPATVACDLLPMPQSVELQGGRFAFDGNVSLESAAGEEDNRILTAYLAESPLAFSADGKKSLKLEVAAVEGLTSPEGYRLEATKESVKITSPSGAGLFYGLQTILQLVDDNGSIPTGVITDEPQLAYRGMMLDVSRHFFGKEFVKKQIDALAHFKMNRLHLHLTDAAGWRIEIKKYPRLTQFAAWRSKQLW